jgi:hypothetical protein
MEATYQLTLLDERQLFTGCARITANREVTPKEAHDQLMAREAIG